LVNRREIINIVKCVVFRLAGNVASMKNGVYVKKVCKTGAKLSYYHCEKK